MKYCAIFVGVLFIAAAQVLVKYTSLYEFWSKKFLIYLGLSISAYGLAFLFQSYLMRLFPLSRIAPAMSIGTMIMVFLCGIYLFNEDIGAKQIIGLITGTVSIYLILS